MSFFATSSILFIINIIGLYPQRKRIRLTNLIIVSCFLFFLAGIRDTPDIENYIRRFSADFYSVKDAGFNFLARFFYNQGWDYYQFQTFIYFVAISFICQGMIRVVKRRTVVYLLYFIYPLLLNAVQIRYMLATSIFVFGVCVCSIEENSLKQKVKWVILISLSSIIHVMMLVFIPFVFIHDKKKIIRIASSAGLMISVLIYIIPDSILNIIFKLISIIDHSSRVAEYAAVATRYGGVIMIIEALVLCYYSFQLYKYCKRQQSGIYADEINYSSFICHLMQYSLIFTPLYVINGNFTRLIQCDTILLYGLLSIASNMSRCERSSVSMIKVKLNMLKPALLGMTFLLYHVISLWIGSYNSIVKVLF